MRPGHRKSKASPSVGGKLGSKFKAKVSKEAESTSGRRRSEPKKLPSAKEEVRARAEDQRKLLDTATQQNAVLEGIKRVFEESLACDTEEELGRACLRIAEAITQSKFAFIGEINPATGGLDDMAISDPGWEACRMQDPAGREKRVPTGFKIHGVYGRVLQDGKGFFTNDPSTHPDSIGTPVGHPPLRAFLGVPLMREGKTFGMVAVGNREGGYRESDLKAMEALAGPMVEVLGRHRMQEKLRWSEARERKQREFLECVIGNAGSCIAVVQGRELRYTMANAAFQAFAGNQPMVGRTYREVFPEAAAAGAEALIQHVLETGEPWKVESYRAPVPGRPDAMWQGQVVRLPAVAGEEPSALAVIWDVTERKLAEEAVRKRAEEALRLREEEFRSLAEAMPQIVWATRPDGWNIYFNQQWVDYTGMSLEESYGHGWNKPFHPDDQQRAWEAWQRATQHDERYSLECRLRRADGVYRWWLVRGEPMRGANGEVVKWFGTCTDIEDIKRAEATLQEANELLEQRVAERTAALQESQQLLQDVIDGSPSPIFLKDSAGKFLTINTALEKMLGRAREELRGKTDYDIAPQEMADFWRGHDKQVMETGKPIQIEEAAELPDGHYIFLANKFPLVHANGQIYGVGAISHDITERKQAEDAVRAHVARLAAVLEAQREIANATVEYAALRQLILERMTGLLAAEGATLEIADGEEMVVEAATGSAAPCVGLRLKTAGSLTGLCLTSNQILRSDDTESDPRADREVSRQTGARSMLAMPLRYDERSFGVLRVLSSRPAAFLAGAEETVRMMSEFMGVTLARQKAQEALRRSERLYRAIGESIDYGVWICDPQGRNIYASESLLKLVGITPEQCRDFGWGSVLHPDDAAATIEAWKQCVQTGGPWFREHRYLGVDGQYHPILACGVAVRDERGQITHWAGINLDISRVKKAEATIQASLHEKEVLLKEIHHRVKNNLQVIASLVDLQAEDLADPALLDVFTDIRHRVRSMALVHEKLYQSESLARVDFADYMQSLLSYLSRSHGKPGSCIELKCDLQPVPLSVEKAVPCGLMVNELVSNAFKHAFRGRSQGEVRAGLELDAVGRVRLRVADDGVGLPLGLDWRQARSLGLRLIQLLAGQLRASVEVRTGNGTAFEIAFEPEAKPESD
jgi:PAS domain S-box-containing protein